MDAAHKMHELEQQKQPERRERHGPKCATSRRRQGMIQRGWLSKRSAVGKWIEFYRIEKGWSIRDLARGTGFSHAYVADIELGRKIPPNKTLRKISDALGLSSSDGNRLWQALEYAPDDPVESGFFVPADALIQRESEKDVSEVWVLDQRPSEIDNEKWLRCVARNLKRGCGYVYFLPNRTQSLNLRNRLVTRVGTKVLERRLTCIQVPQTLHVLFFHMASAIFWRKENAQQLPILGVHAFLGPDGKGELGRGVRMADLKMRELVDFLGPIVQQTRENGRFLLMEPNPAFIRL